MDAVDAADRIQESADELRSDERFRRRAALCIGIMAMLLAIAGLGGGNATKETINNNIAASDTWAFYQAKNIRQTDNQNTATELETLLLTAPSLSADARAEIQKQIDSLKATVARYESDPSTGEGKRELQEKAQAFEVRRDRAGKQDPYFDYSQAFLQIAIVLGSVSIVSNSRPLLWVSLGLGSLATLLMLDAFTLLVDLPIG